MFLGGQHVCSFIRHNGYQQAADGSIFFYVNHTNQASGEVHPNIKGADVQKWLRARLGGVSPELHA